MPHDLPLPSLTGQVPYDVEEAITRLHSYSLALDADRDAATEALSTLAADLRDARAAIATLERGTAASIVSILQTTRIVASQITLEGFTPDSVLFVDSAAALAEDPPNFTWSATSRQLELRGDLALPGLLLLSTAEPTVVAGNRLGQINFRAPVEAAGGDAILIAASVWAEATNTFSAIANETALILATATTGVATEKWRITHDGDLLAAVTGAALGWATRSRLLSSGDGLLTLLDAAEADFGRLMFGGVTSSFPSLKRSSAALIVRLADDSADAAFQCAGLTATAIVGTTLNTGQGANELYDMDQNVLQASAVVFATVDTGQGANELYAMDQDVQVADNVQFANLRATGAVRFGTHTALGAETLSGYITITDDGGTPRLLGVIS